MKKKKCLSDKVTIKCDWFELYDLKLAVKNEILNSIKVCNLLNVKFPYYNSDKNLLKMYKKLVKLYKTY